MEIKTERNEGKLTVSLEGRLDTTTAPELEVAIKDLDGVTELIIDMAKLEYISSAGLRVFLINNRLMKYYL